MYAPVTHLRRGAEGIRWLVIGSHNPLEGRHVTAQPHICARRDAISGFELLAGPIPVVSLVMRTRKTAGLSSTSATNPYPESV
jgi:hypothetical protein